MPEAGLEPACPKAENFKFPASAIPPLRLQARDCTKETTCGMRSEAVLGNLDPEIGGRPPVPRAFRPDSAGTSGRPHSGLAEHSRSHLRPEPPHRGLIKECRSSRRDWRRRADSNRRMRVLQTLALPLGHVAPGSAGTRRNTRPGESKNGAGNGIRTRDPNLGKVVLYH